MKIDFQHKVWLTWQEKGKLQLYCSIVAIDSGSQKYYMGVSLDQYKIHHSITDTQRQKGYSRLLATVALVKMGG